MKAKITFPFTLATKVLVTLFLVFAVSALTQPLEAAGGLRGKRIVVDPGHGGSNPGAVGPTGLRESDANWRVAVALKYFLEKRGGATVLLTRDQDHDQSLAGRVWKANSWGAHRFVSVHHNSAANRAWNGAETYSYHYGSWASHDLRNKVQKQLVRGLGTRDLGAKTASFYVLRNTKMPAILTEPGFVTNYYQEARLKDSAYNWKEAWYIYAGIAEHFGVQP